MEAPSGCCIQLHLHPACLPAFLPPCCPLPCPVVSLRCPPVAARMSVPSSSLDALDGFCVLAGSSSGPQCVLLIKQVLKHPHIFVFGELLDCPSIQQVTTHAPHRPAPQRTAPHSRARRAAHLRSAPQFPGPRVLTALPPSLPPCLPASLLLCSLAALTAAGHGAPALARPAAPVRVRHIQRLQRSNRHTARMKHVTL